MDTKKKTKRGLLAAFAERLKEDKRLEIAVYAMLVLLVVALYVSTLLPQKEKSAASVVPDSSSSLGEQEVEERLERVLSAIRGAGKVDVMITYETGPELVTAMTTDTNINRSQSSDNDKESSTEQQTQSEKPATVSGNGGTEPIVITQKRPSVRGVIVVAEGAGNIAVRLSLQRAVETVLSVPASCIEVFEREVPEQ